MVQPTRMTDEELLLEVITKSKPKWLLGKVSRQKSIGLMQRACRVHVC